MQAILKSPEFHACLEDVRSLQAIRNAVYGDTRAKEDLARAALDEAESHLDAAWAAALLGDRTTFKARKLRAEVLAGLAQGSEPEFDNAPVVGLDEDVDADGGMPGLVDSDEEDDEDSDESEDEEEQHEGDQVFADQVFADQVNEHYTKLWGTELEQAKRLAAGRYEVRHGDAIEWMGKLAKRYAEAKAADDHVSGIHMFSTDPWYLPSVKCFYDDPEKMDNLLSFQHQCARPRCVSIFFTSWQRAHKIDAAAKRSNHWEAAKHLLRWETKAKYARGKGPRSGAGKMIIQTLEYAVVLYHYEKKTRKKKGGKSTVRYRYYHGSKETFSTQVRSRRCMTVNGYTFSGYQPPSKYQRMWASFADKKPLRPQAEKKPEQYKALMLYFLPFPKAGEQVNMRVVDLCSGSAAMGRACIRLNVNYIGVDEDEKVVEPSQQFLYQALIAQTRTTALTEHLHLNSQQADTLREILGLTPLGSCTNAPPARYCEVMDVAVRDTGFVADCGNPVGRGLYGAREAPGPTGVFMFGDFTLKQSAHGESRECIVFDAEQLQEIKMVISRKCPAFYINHYKGLAKRPNVVFHEIEDWNELGGGNTHQLIQVVATRPIGDGEQWLADYGSEYRFAGKASSNPSSPVQTPVKRKMTGKAYKAAAKARGLTFDQALDEHLEDKLTAKERRDAVKAAAEMSSTDDEEGEEAGDKRTAAQAAKGKSPAEEQPAPSVDEIAPSGSKDGNPGKQGAGQKKVAASEKIAPSESKDGKPGKQGAGQKKVAASEKESPSDEVVDFTEGGSKDGKPGKEKAASEAMEEGSNNSNDGKGNDRKRRTTRSSSGENPPKRAKG